MQDSLYPIHADFLQEILAAGRAHLKQEIVVIKISHSALVFCGPVAQLLKLRGNSVLLHPLIGKLWRNSWPGSIYKILERREFFYRVSRPSGPSRDIAYHGIDQLRGLMFLTPGKHFFLKVSSHYLFRAIADDFYDEKRGEDHNLAEDEDLGGLIRRGIEAEKGAAGNNHADHSDPLDSFIDWLMKLLESDNRGIDDSEYSDEEPRHESELDRLSRELEERMEGRHIRIRPGRRRVCRVLGLYDPIQRIVTLYPRMWQLVAKDSGAPSAAEIGVIVALHEFAHAVSHVSHKEWALQDFIQTPSGIHEIIAERGSLKILPFYQHLMAGSDLLQAHAWLCKDAPAEYRFWKLLESVGNLGFASILADWRKSRLRRHFWPVLRGDDGWIKGPAKFLKDCGADLRATAASDTVLADAITDLELAFKNLGAPLRHSLKSGAGGTSIDLEPVIKALEACWEPILFGKSGALRKEFIHWRGSNVKWRGKGSQVLQLDREQLRIRLVEWLVTLHAGRKGGSKGAGVAAILDPDDDDWADLIRDVLSELDSVI